jgi:hypothetical protein
MVARSVLQVMNQFADSVPAPAAYKAAAARKSSFIGRVRVERLVLLALYTHVICRKTRRFNFDDEQI